MKIKVNKNSQTQNQKKNIVFFGKLWINTVEKEGKHKGEKFMSGNIDNRFEEIILGNDDQIQVWKNNKREGKKDADFRISLLTDQDVPDDINGPTSQDIEVKEKDITDTIMA